MASATTAKRPRVMSGMRPTGNLHLGHYVGVLTQWVKYCDTADAFFEIADLHALTTAFADPQSIRDARNAMVVDWLAAGVDPAKSTFYLQSGIPEISELEVLLGMITPISWLERVPSFKGQIEALGAEIAPTDFWAIRCCSSATSRSSAANSYRSVKTKSRTWSLRAKWCAVSTIFIAAANRF